jgi:hypothetical protein
VEGRLAAAFAPAATALRAAATTTTAGTPAAAATTDAAREFAALLTALLHAVAESIGALESATGVSAACRARGA